MLWLSFRFDAPLLNVPMTYLFTLFSHVLWSIYVLFSIGLMECVVWRKKVISAAAGHATITCGLCVCWNIREILTQIIFLG